MLHRGCASARRLLRENDLSRCADSNHTREGSMSCLLRTFGAVLAVSSAASAGTVEVQVCVARSKKELGNSDGTPWANCRQRLPVRQDFTKDFVVSSDDILIVRFRDKGAWLSVHDANLLHVQLFARGVERAQFAPKPEEQQAGEYHATLEDLDDEAHKELVTVQVAHGDSTNPTITTRYFRHDHKGQLYGRGGFWLPVGLFSSNLRSGDEGIPFAAMPVGIGWGARYHWSRNIFAGVSVIASWLVSPELDAGGKRTGSYAASGLTLGGVIDAGGYLLVGGAYGFDFRSGHENPGALLVVGPAPKLLEFVTSLGE